MKVGPTVRICLLSEGASEVAGGAFDGADVDGGVESGAVVATEPFLAGAGADFSEPIWARLARLALDVVIFSFAK